MIFVVVIIIDACFPDYDASLNQKGTVPSFQMNLEMLHPLEIMQICCKIMEYIYIVKVFPKTLVSWSPTYDLPI
jgi:hypothetical protein